MAIEPSFFSDSFQQMRFYASFELSFCVAEDIWAGSRDCGVLEIWILLSGDIFKGVGVGDLVTE